jgi:hypothetical protein
MATNPNKISTSKKTTYKKKTKPKPKKDKVVPPSFDPGRFRQGEERSMAPFTTAAMPTATVTAAPGLVSTGQASAGIPGQAAIVRQQYDAALAAGAAQNYAREAAIRELLSQGITASQGGAADIYGGRAPALLGQAVTGTQRDYLTNQAAEEIRYQAEQEALRRAYSEAVGTAYQGLGQSALDRASARSAQAAQIRKLGIG